MADLTLHASRYTLLDAPRTRESLVYGKVDVDINAAVRGPVDALTMRGSMSLLGTTNVTYVLTDSPLLILDEATSSIDTLTEQRVQKAFAKMMEGKTSFVVAHRLSTIKEADVILVMKDGNIIEQGRHEDLLKKAGFYSTLYNSQFS